MPEAARHRPAGAAQENENQAQRGSGPSGDQEQAMSSLIFGDVSRCGLAIWLVFCLERQRRTDSMLEVKACASQSRVPAKSPLCLPHSLLTPAQLESGLLCAPPQRS